jgi:hypothetical protein
MNYFDYPFEILLFKQHKKAALLLLYMLLATGTASLHALADC